MSTPVNPVATPLKADCSRQTHDDFRGVGGGRTSLFLPSLVLKSIVTPLTGAFSCPLAISDRLSDASAAERPPGRYASINALIASMLAGWLDLYDSFRYISPMVADVVYCIGRRHVYVRYGHPSVIWQHRQHCSARCALLLQMS